MLRGLIRFNRGLLRMPLAAQVWVGWLIMVNLVVPLQYWGQSLEARATVVATTLGGLLMGAITARTGFSRLLGLGHVLWIPLLGWLLIARQPWPLASTGLGLWLRVLVVTNAISLVIDAVDVARYVRGEHGEMVKMD